MNIGTRSGYAVHNAKSYLVQLSSWFDKITGLQNKTSQILYSYHRWMAVIMRQVCLNFIHLRQKVSWQFTKIAMWKYPTVNNSEICILLPKPFSLTLTSSPPFSFLDNLLRKGGVQKGGPIPQCTILWLNWTSGLC